MIDFVINTLAFVFALGLIIFVHELGHLLAAKGFGIRVLTFSLGFGKRLWGFKRGGTDYRVAALPLGGYVKLGGELPEESTGDPREFLSRPRWQRIVVYLAGPAMNAVLAVALVALVFMVGIQVPNLQDIPAVVGSVEDGSSAARVGLQAGDRIVEVNGEAMDGWQEVRFALMTSPDRPLQLTYRRGDELSTVEVTPSAVPKYEVGDTAGIYPKVLPRVTQVQEGSPAATAGLRAGDELRAVDGQPISSTLEFVEYIEERPGQEVRLKVRRDGRVRTLTVVPEVRDGKGKIGIGIGIFQRYGPLRAVVESASYNVQIVRETFAFLGKILTREISARSAVSGPIGIAAFTGDAARRGFVELLYVMGFISISIGVLNLLPIPVLDGGQILLLLVESLIRRDLSMRLKEWINQVGFVLLVLIMLVVIFFDLTKVLPLG